ncbi:hypothetical protein [Desulfosporosinus orientis]|nr:hypothetical protein [Desulfosporosinus orientis]
MESVSECINCGECLNRCPYELPIPEILQRNLNLYTESLRIRVICLCT